MGSKNIQISINVYDLTPLNRLLRWAKTGVYHTGVVLAGIKEYYFGYALWGHTGVDFPRDVGQLPPVMAGALYKTIVIGESRFNMQGALRVIRESFTERRWLSDHYHVLYNNCNDYSQEMCRRLVGNRLTEAEYPFWVQRGVAFARCLFSVSVGYWFNIGMVKMAAFGQPWEEIESNSGRDEVDVEGVPGE